MALVFIFTSVTQRPEDIQRVLFLQYKRCKNICFKSAVVAGTGGGHLCLHCCICPCLSVGLQQSAADPLLPLSHVDGLGLFGEWNSQISVG